MRQSTPQPDNRPHCVPDFFTGGKKRYLPPTCAALNL